MRVRERLEPLLEQGVIQEILRALMSGKEAEVFLVLSGGEERVAKVYKNAQFRSFQNRADYTEGRTVRNSREQRAMNKRSRHGRAKTEDAWRSAEVDAIHLLRTAGVRVPEPFAFTEGVLVMELVKGEDGAPAPRLVDVQFTAEGAYEVFHIVLRDVVKMLCAGIIHADLSEFNVLMSPTGPVIIDFPQAVDPARNQSARKLLIRDVKNITSFLGRFAPQLRRTQYGPELWDLYESNALNPDTELTGKYEPSKAEVSSLLEDMRALEEEARERREALGLPPPGPARRPVVDQPPPPKGSPKTKPRPRRGRDKQQRRGGKPSPAQPPHDQQTALTGNGPKKRRRRRRRNSGGQGPQNGPASQGGQSTAARPPAPPAPKPVTGDPSAAPRKRLRLRRRRRGGGGKPTDSTPTS